MVDLGEIARVIGKEYLRSRATTPFQRKALRAIQRCRTEAMGSISAVCDNCGIEHLVFRSCRNRNCPRCQAQARAAWLDAREQELLPVPYFHVVFTVPEMLNDIALYCPGGVLRSASAGSRQYALGRRVLKAPCPAGLPDHSAYVGSEFVAASPRALRRSRRRIFD